MKKVGIGVGVILLILIFVVLFSNKATAKNEDGSTESTPQPPAPPEPTNTNSNGNTLPTRPLDPTSGEGLLSISSYAKSLIKDSSLMEELRRSNKIGGSLDAGMTGNLRIQQTAYLTSQLGVIDFYGIPLVPPIADGGKFMDRMKTFSSQMKSPRRKIDELGETEWIKQMVRVGDFTNESGYRMVKPSLTGDNDLSDFGFGECNQIRSSKRKDCRRDHHEDFGRGLHIMAENMKTETMKFEKVLFDYAAQKLVDNGWSFIGYFPSNSMP